MKWWFSEYDYNYKDYSYSSQSGALSWMSKLFGYETESVRNTDYRASYQKLLDQLQNSANIINQGEPLKVRWASDDDINDVIGENLIRLNPDQLVKIVGKEYQTSPEKLDALTGRVYLASMLASTVDPAAWEQGTSSGDQTASLIWQAIETSIARQKVISDWAGFSPYIAAESQDSSASHAEMQKYLDESAKIPSAEAAAKGMAWNLLNRGCPVKMPTVYDAAIEEVAMLMEERIEPANRYKVSKQISDILRSHFTVDQSKETSVDEEIDGEEDEDEGDSDSQFSQIDSPGPKTHDSSIFGDRIRVQTEENLQDMVPADGNDKLNPMGNDSVGHLTPAQTISMRPAPDEYRALVSQLRTSINQVVNNLLFNNTVISDETYGHRVGEIDENSLYKLFMKDDRLMMRREVPLRKEVAISLVVDESGSMASDGRYRAARNVAVTLYEAFSKIRGLSVSVYGHTSIDTSGGGEHVQIREYVSPKTPDNASSMMRIAAVAENLDSWAIYHIAQRMLVDYAYHSRRILIMISDGEPAGHSYGGDSAMQHVKAVSESCLSRGVEVYGVGVANAFGADTGDMMYGRGKYVVLQDVESSIQVISRFIRQVTRGI